MPPMEKGLVWPPRMGGRDNSLSGSVPSCHTRARALLPPLPTKEATNGAPRHFFPNIRRRRRGLLSAAGCMGLSLPSRLRTPFNHLRKRCRPAPPRRWEATVQGYRPPPSPLLLLIAFSLHPRDRRRGGGGGERKNLSGNQATMRLRR